VNPSPSLEAAAPTQAAGAEPDLFGHIPVSRLDVYAWLLAVVGVDPASFRASTLARQFQVVEKIVAAKLDGSFDGIVEPARATARFRELSIAGIASTEARNDLGLGEQEAVAQAGAATAAAQAPARAPRRSPEVIAREKERAKVQKRGRGKLRSSLLNRWMPARLPDLQSILQDLGGPDAEAIAVALRVHPTTVRRWLREGEAPYAIKLALFWMTSWGISTVDSVAHLDAINSLQIARIHESEASQLRKDLLHIATIADFGAANDPLPSVSVPRPAAADELPAPPPVPPAAAVPDAPNGSEDTPRQPRRRTAGGRRG
jgi:hypothetical protein